MNAIRPLRWHLRCGSLCSRSLLAHASSDTAAASPPVTPGKVHWPMLLGGVTVAGILGGGTLLNSDTYARQLVPSMERMDRITKEGGAVSVKDTVGLVCGYCLASLPIDELRVTLLKAGAVPYWALVLQQTSLGQEFIAMNSLADLLTGDVAVRTFHGEPAWYVSLVNALCAALEPQDAVGSRYSIGQTFGGDRLCLTISLAATLSWHPSFKQCSGDERLWEALLEAGLAGLPQEPELGLAWSALACAAAQRPTLARAMLLHRGIKEQLLCLAEADAEELAAAGVPELQRDFALAALHRLAVRAQAETTTRVAIATSGQPRFIDEYLSIDLPALPVSPPPLKSDESLLTSGSLAVLLCSVGGLAWGALRGVRGTSRMLQPIWKIAAVTCAGSSILQVVSEASGAVKQHFCTVAKVTGSGEITVEHPPATYASLKSAAVAEAVDSAVWFGVLQMLVQTGRAPFAFGGWVVGAILRSIAMSDL